ncbi:hypothetical protein CJ203_06640 [Corynebacterium tuscaniense]|uniref:AAA+ ATPase domain-containing protein n=1 Tax=Corynebacterium tuscaniense TaxID=302449 RepID=A0A2N6T4J3_9CORY|nr:AAA family ATPase [Corynebacterium tuscaniense]PMC64232.1 hypothetical protein CJ203_06640 [Corynebacterium tuscaniense]
MPISPYLSEIEFEGQDRVNLQPGSILVAVGPNNAGKSHFLAQLRAKLFGASINGTAPENGLITGVHFNWNTNHQTTEDHLVKLATNNWSPLSGGFSAILPDGETKLSRYVSQEEIQQIANQDQTFKQFLELFVRWDEPISRILESEWQEPRQRGGASLRLAQHDSPLDKVSDAFNIIFKQPISVYDKRDGRIGFLLGRPAFNGPSLNSAPDTQTLNFMDEAPKMCVQGMGMRNVFGLLARFLTDNRSIILMDEPEAFLHPPQAAELGELLGQLCQESGKQIICATHDRNLLAGLARGASGNLRVRRFDYKLDTVTRNPVFNSKEVHQNPWETIRNKSRVRYSNVLDALFSRRVILVEAERDALFYHETLDFLTNEDPQLELHSDDYLFLPVGGNAEFAPMITLMRELSTPVFVIGDLDLLADEKRLVATAAAAGIPNHHHLAQLQNELFATFETRYEQLPLPDEQQKMINLRAAIQSLEGGTTPELVTAAETLLNQIEKRHNQNRKNKIVSLMAKSLGRAEPNSPEGKLKTEILGILQTGGIHLLPIGELEDFDRKLFETVGKQDWVAEAIAERVYASEKAQSFIRSVITER